MDSLTRARTQIQVDRTSETHGGNPSYQLYEVRERSSLINFSGGRVTEFKKCVNSIKMIVIKFMEGAQIGINK